ncbi:diguanylate cyclase [Sphingomonas sp. BT553]|uniref:Diguanylate cyclase n=2 Tax=Sphingomonas mollis TaxID=2795726 RepID=A0ABS0XQC8_9SPHN|nr:diguanylate cyclase [Sphingomonas sp. BT553]
MGFSAPRLAITRWLAFPGCDTPAELHPALLGTLFGTLTVFFAALVNSVLVTGVVAFHEGSAPFIGWFVVEVAICTARLAVLAVSLHRAGRGRSTPTDLHLWMSVLWALSIGYGGFITITAGDWVSTVIVCLSSAAMAGGACLRNYAAPRFVVLLLTCNLVPCCLAAILSDQPALLVLLVQTPLFMVGMTAGAFRLNRALVATMQAESAMVHLALHDPLTGLLNRTGLEQGFAGRAGDALCYIDLDGFKRINDRYGHAAGDGLLQTVADRLRQVAGPDALVTRIGGDEFVVIAADHDNHSAIALGNDIAAVLREPHAIAGDLVVSGASIGIAVHDGGVRPLADLMARADRSLYRVKAMGGGARLADPERQDELLPF